MHIVAHGLEVSVATAIDDQRLVASAKQVTDEIVPSIEAHSVCPEKPFHPGHQIATRRLHDQMKVVRHQAKGMHLPARFLAHLTQCVEKTAAILVIMKNSLTMIPSIHEMIHRTGVLDSEFSSHGQRVKGKQIIVNYRD